MSRLKCACLNCCLVCKGDTLQQYRKNLFRTPVKPLLCVCSFFSQHVMRTVINFIAFPGHLQCCSKVRIDSQFRSDRWMKKVILLNEPGHGKTNKITCASSEHSDKPAHPHSLIRVFACAHWIAYEPSFLSADS